MLYFFVALFGLAIGSFLNVVICRLEKGESIVSPPSHCTQCGTRLKPLDLIPVFSFIFLRGKCRYCGCKISFRYPLVELITATVFMLLFWKYGISFDFLFGIYLMSVLIAVFFIDLDTKTIPDELVVAGLLGGVFPVVCNLFYPVAIYGDRWFFNPIIGMFAASGFLFIIAVIGSLIYKTDDAMGMGDVKIFVPIGMFLGWRMSIAALVISIFLAGIAGFILLVTGKKNRKEGIPFGPFIVTAVFATLMIGWELLEWYILFI
ncbi:MAG TPA: prepilin peptidase [Clostridiaceae bacterium]|nr:prepilin peptidase [Clostridiaceae bacterium]